MARLLVDMNLSTEWIPLLKAAGHEAVHWSEVGDPRAPDTELMTWASSRGYAVFTHDLDFGTMLALSGADGPSVLQVRCLNVLPEAIGSLVLNLLRSYSDELEQGALIVADERRQRVRILPLEPRNPINS
jgi:predicted nuclease of predicted toxin-antitoxin system